MAAFKAVLYLLLLLSLIGSAGATTYTVGSSGCDYTTIQAAVNAASSYDTVYVCNGSYTENVDIATAHLTIEGEGRDVVTVTAASISDHVFYVNAIYVNISGLKATGATNGAKSGVWVNTDADNCNISNNNLSSNNRGIMLYYSDNTVINNNIANFGDEGIYISHSNGSTVSDNTANENNDTAGIYLSESDNNTIDNNTANTNTKDGVYIKNSDNNTASNNTINSNTKIGIHLYNSSNNTITDNNASYNIYDGIQLYYLCDKNTISDNIFSNNDDSGVAVCFDSYNNTINNNTANTNIENGFYITSGYNTLKNNTANSNGYNGVTLRSSSHNIFDHHNSTNNTKYDYRSYYTSRNNTLLDCNLDNSTSMMNDSTSQWIIKYTTSNITDYSDTTINQTISPTNVTTTIEPTVDDYNITMTTLDDFSASTDVSTATLQLIEFASGGHSKFNVSSFLHTIVTTFNLGTFPPGQVVRLKRNNLDVTCARAGASGIATFIYDGGYSDNEFETDPVGLYVYLNDTQNYTFTNDSYDATSFTSQVTITSTGSPPCAVSVEMPLITNSTYTKLGYTVTNVTGGFRVTNASGWAAINFTVTNTTTVRISPSAAAKTSNLPATVVTGIGGVTVIVYLLRRRRR